MTGALRIGAATPTRLEFCDRAAIFKSSLRTAFGSVRCGSGMRLAFASVTGTTAAPFTVADHNSVPSGSVSRKFGLPRFFTK